MKESKEVRSWTTCCDCKENCMCSGSGLGHMCRHSLLRKFFIAVLFVLLFCFAVQFGELKGMYQSYYRDDYYMSKIDNTYYKYMNCLKTSEASSPKTTAQ
ncbi:MAG: hypothetical protein WCX27_00905 [Candidatus Paceibacterota bacterium]